MNKRGFRVLRPVGAAINLNLVHVVGVMAGLYKGVELILAHARGSLSDDFVMNIRRPQAIPINHGKGIVQAVAIAIPGLRQPEIDAQVGRVGRREPPLCRTHISGIEEI